MPDDAWLLRRKCRHHGKHCRESGGAHGHGGRVERETIQKKPTSDQAMARGRRRKTGGLETFLRLHSCSMERTISREIFPGRSFSLLKFRRFRRLQKRRLLAVAVDAGRDVFHAHTRHSRITQQATCTSSSILHCTRRAAEHEDASAAPRGASRAAADAPATVTGLPPHSRPPPLPAFRARPRGARRGSCCRRPW